MLKSFLHWDLLVSPAAIWQKIVAAYIAFTEMNVERYNFLKGLHLQLEHLQHQNHTLFVGTKNHFELHWYSPQIFNFMLCFPNFFWKLKKNPHQNKPGLQELKIMILCCLFHFPKFFISSCCFAMSFENDWLKEDWMCNWNICNIIWTKACVQEQKQIILS